MARWAFASLRVAILAACVVLSFHSAIAQSKTDGVISSKPAADTHSPKEKMSEAYSDASLILRTASATDTLKAHLSELYGDFNQRKVHAKLQDRTGEEVDRFWTEIGLSFLPAIEKNDKAAAIESYRRLSEIYTKCCNLPVSEDKIAPDTHHLSAVPQIESSVEAQPRFQLFFIIGLILCISILIGAFILIYRRRAMPTTRAMPAALEDEDTRTVKPLFLVDPETKAHVNLDANLAALRNSLYALGEPRCDSDKLFFGNQLINGDNEIVDQIKIRFGCYATIFKDDNRVATNVLLPDGSRALGTKLARGPAYEAVINQAKVYGGIVTLFERPILGLYEPIFDSKSAKEVIGILFVGI